MGITFDAETNFSVESSRVASSNGSSKAIAFLSINKSDEVMIKSGLSSRQSAVVTTLCLQLV